MKERYFMGLRYRKSIKIAPGVKVNLNRKSASVTIGGKGVHKTFNSNGQTTTSVNLPVKGLSYTDRKSSTASKRKSTASGSSSVLASHKLLFQTRPPLAFLLSVLLSLLLASLLLGLLSPLAL